ncbi:GH1 family beta-glucosidase [Palleronia sp. LCG004]|uniref:GH1 family beta-glucosidase n=1 Tax=Palleronia sp. LCG004 TaxID=3079304 RepID=UPI002943A74D|nr:GH1 family beta-glucosidase [Palleronia sp. LCG004]WOI57257.1 GH1 family beta-glucosidase [Palleronia sp. LCG004]
MLELKRGDFPRDFLFGASTSSYQIEGHSFGGAGPTHWDTFAATPGNVVGGQNGAIACDHYNRMDEDLDLLKDGGFDVYRFSTSWARVMPEGRGRVNAEGLDFYDRLVDGLLERGIKPAATLYHWELPAALADLGGWSNRDIASWFAEFTQVVMERIGDRVWSAAPINEFFCVAWMGHFLGHHAPGLRDVRATARAMHHVLLAHGRSIEVMRGLGMENLGAVCNLEYTVPVDGSDAAARAARTYDGFYNRFYLGGLFNRAYPADLMEDLDPHMPEGYRDDMDLIGQKLDWCGINYYTRKIVAPAGGPWPHLETVDGPLGKTQLGWEIYPDGLYHLLKRVHDGYTRDIPLYVTENGMANDDRVSNGAVDDKARIDYLNAHLARVKRACDEKIPVKGYFTWSLLDNYEWNEGYDPRFGIVHVDFKSLKRTPKASYHALAKVLRT